MAVKMEFLNLIVPIEKINQSNCPGGFEGHLDSIGRNNLGGPMYYDKHLFRMGFMDGWMIGGHIAQLESYGLVGEKEVNGELKWIDFCVIANGFDSNPRCDWLEFGESEFLDRGRRITWLKGQEQGYHYPDSLFRSFDLPETDDTPLEIQQTGYEQYWNDPIRVHDWLKDKKIGFKN